MAAKQMSIFSGVGNIRSKIDEQINHWKIYIDGASRNNPGPSGVGVYILQNDHPFKQLGCFTGKKTNNQAEYLALLLGLFWLRSNIGQNDLVQIVSDSQLLVRQIKGIYRVKHELLKPLFQVAKILLSDMKYDIAHVLRAHNVRADKLANVGVDKKVPLPKDFVLFLRENGVSL